MKRKMPTLHKPAIYLPEYIITLEETIALAKKDFKDNPNLEKSVELITNTGVKKAHYTTGRAGQITPWFRLS